MYIKPNTLNASPGHAQQSALGGAWDDISSGFASFTQGFAKGVTPAAGMPPAMSPTGIVLTPGAPGYNPDLAAAYMAQQNQGLQLSDILLYGGIAAAVYFLVIRKKAE